MLNGPVGSFSNRPNGEVEFTSVAFGCSYGPIIGNALETGGRGPVRKNLAKYRNKKAKNPYPKLPCRIPEVLDIQKLIKHVGRVATSRNIANSASAPFTDA